MGGLLYNEIAKIVAQRRFAVVIFILTVITVLAAFSARGFAGSLHITAVETVSTVVSGGFAQLVFPFLIAVIAGDIVAGELTAGTLKLLLIRPVTRWKIWLSKFLAAYITSAVVILYAGACLYAAVGGISSFGLWSSPDIVNGVTTTYGIVMLKAYALEAASLVSVVSVFMLISTFVESGVAAVGLCAGLTIICSTAVPIIRAVPHPKWIDYLFFEHWQMAGHITGGFPVDNWTITGSLALLAVWSALCIAAGLTIFQIRDVKS